MNTKVILTLVIVVMSTYVVQQVYHTAWKAEQHARMTFCLALGETQSVCEMRVAGLAK